jgi:hypothetical protein
MHLNRLCSLGILATTVALASIAQPARAISFTLGNEADTQASMTGMSGFSGETNQGAYSIYTQTEGFNTVTFNAGDFSVFDNQNQQVDNAGIAYSYTGNKTGNARIVSDDWAPTFEAPRDNTSKYLTAFSGTDVQIDLDTTHNYFGINWGSAHNGNEFSFYNGDSLVQKFVYYGDNRTFAADTNTTNVASALQAYGTKGNGNQYNAYFNFFAESSDDIFNRIVISQAGGGGL